MEQNLPLYISYKKQQIARGFLHCCFDTYHIHLKVSRHTYPTCTLSVHAVAHVYPAQLHHQSHQAGDSAECPFRLHHHPLTLPAFSEKHSAVMNFSPFPADRKSWLPLWLRFPDQQSPSDHTHSVLSVQVCARENSWSSSCTVESGCVSKPDVTCHSNPDTH